MELWFIFIVSLCVSALLKSLFSPFTPSKKPLPTKTLPPGPPALPFIGNLFWFRKSLVEIERILKDFQSSYGHGGIISARVGSRPAIFVASHSLAHRALVQNGSVFADRPDAVATRKIASSNQHNISSAFYGPTWRQLRRNLTFEILHPSRIKSYSNARRWVLDILISRLKSQSGDPVVLIDHFRYAMFCLLVLMCLGDKIDEKQIKQIEEAERRLVVGFTRFSVLNLWPRIGKILLRKRWQEFFQILNHRKETLLPLIKAREKMKQQNLNTGEESVCCYVDTLLDLELPEEKRRLNDDELTSLCSEFLIAGTDTTTTVLQWTMANLVKYPSIQEKLYEEIKGVVGGREKVTEYDLQKMKYLKAVILEALRRHPPGHFVLPHAVSEETELGGYLIPKNATVNFMVAEMGWDPNVWDEPMAFKPERFLKTGDEIENDFDITGSKEIKMMPFGAGRRICPGLGLATLHLEYFVANLIWHFQLTPVDGKDVDLSEKLEFTMVMKDPLEADLSVRSR